jgi:hypothetical protein
MINPLNEKTTPEIKGWLDDLWNVRFIARGRVVKVYEESEDSGDDVKDLSPGQVTVDIIGLSYKNAWVVFSYGMRPDMQESDEGQNKAERAFNQQFGFFAMPRIGDSVLVIGLTEGRGATATDFFVIGSVYDAGVNRPPPIDKEDFHMIHRSGASIRLNDTYVGGGSISSAGTVTEDHMAGLTGNLSMTGNRAMFLAGRRFLPHGLLAKYGDPRSIFSDAGIETYQNVEGGKQYNEIFSNEQTDTSNYFDPFNDITMGTKYFLSPPSTSDSIIPLADNTLLLLQHGGGVVRIDDHSAASGYSRLTMGAASMSFMVGQDYRDLGLQGDSTSPGDGAGITSGANVFEVQHESGTRIIIDADGNVEIDVPSGKEIRLGAGADENIISDADTTAGEVLLDGLVSLPAREADSQVINHKHGLIAAQTEAKVN